MNFFKVFIASILGVFAAFILIFLFFVSLAALSSGGSEEAYVRDNSYLELSIQGNLPYRSVKDPFDELFNQSSGEAVSVIGLQQVLQNAATDDRIQGIHLKLSNNGGSWVHLAEARKLLATFRDSTDKWIYANTNDIGYTEKGYYLATVADSVLSPPESFFEFDGLFMQGTFYSDFLDKIGVEPIVIRAGKFKSAVEPVLRDDYSEFNEMQLTALVNNTSTEWVRAISEKTGKSAEEINRMLNEQPSISTLYAYENGLIDALMYQDEVESLLASKIGQESPNKLKRYAVDYDDYLTVAKTSSSSKNTIAVLFAEGQILPTPSDIFGGGDNVITGKATIKEIRKLKEDEDVKAVVFFVDSPGGAATTSDIIWRELKLLNEVKPLYTYMGSVAASGGYYIAMGSRKVIAHPQTITGSIGVFGQFFNAKEMLNEKLGVYVDEVKSHDHADWLNLTRPLTKEEEASFQFYVDETYKTFLQRVADNRGQSTEFIHELAQGRVWSGADAMEIGLVDELGSLDDAIQMIAEEAGIEEYKLEYLPKPKDLATQLLERGNVQLSNVLMLSNPVETALQSWRQELERRNGQVMMRMPMELEIK